MTSLSLASVRHRRGGLVASFLSVFLGATVLTAFASLLDTAGGPGVGDDDRTALTIMSSVVGGWGAVIVAFAIGTTLSMATRQRAAELALLRCVGATPGQVVRLITGEVALVGVAATALAVPAGFGCGHAVLGLLQDTGQVAGGVGYRFGAAALGVGAGGAPAAALVAAWVTARRSARRRVADALLNAAAGGRRTSRTRLAAGLVLLVGGVNCAVLTATSLDGRQLQTQSVASEGCILSALGLALLAPVILRAAAAVLGPGLGLFGAPGRLGLAGVRMRFQRAATPLMPIVVCTSIATGTLYMQSIWNSARIGVTPDDRHVETLNYVVVGMIVVFAAVMLVNVLVAEITDRRGEFAQLRLTGATPRQINRLVAAESSLLLVTGLLLGSLAGALTVVPYSIAVTGDALPDASGGVYLAVLGSVTALTLGASQGAARMATRSGALRVLHGAAV